MPMKKFQFFATALFASLVFLTACQKAENKNVDHLNYTLTPILTGDGNNALQIDLQLIGDADGETEILLGQPWGSEKQPEDLFRDITVQGEDAIINPGEANRMRIIRHAPRSPLTITYRLYEKDSRSEFSSSDFFYAPIIRPNLIQIVGTTSLIVPRGPESAADNRQVDARIEWNNLPETWTHVESPSAVKNGPQPLSNFISSVAMAGDFPVIERSVGAKTLSVVVQGEQIFQSEELAENLATILKALNESWDDDPTDYMVSLLSADLGEAVYSFSGSALHHAFVAAGTGNVDLDFLMGFLTHEITHDWIPKRIGKFPDEAVDVYWFSEGFTDYFALTLLRHEGLLSEAEFVDKTNENLREYYESPAVNASSLEIREGFWRSEDIERQPYLRGFLIASEWNKDIRLQSKNEYSLRSALLALKAKAETSETGLPILTNAYLAEHFTPWIGHDSRLDVERFYIDGKTIEPSNDIFGKCATKKTVPVYSYDVGFDPGGSIQAGKIVGLNPESNAFKAGMRGNLRFVDKISGGGGDTMKPMVLSVADGDRVFEISYFPRGSTTIDVPQFVLNSETDVTKNCWDHFD